MLRLVALLSFTAVAVPVNAQLQVQEGGGTLEGLLEQLRGLQEAGALDALGGAGGSALDKARQQGFTDLGALEPADPAELAQVRSQERQQRALVQQVASEFCRNQFPAEAAARIRALLDLSRLEEDFCRRIGDAIFLYGYGIFDDVGRVKGLDVGAISDDYVLGVGDELVITFHGQENNTFTVRVDREGRLSIPDWQPIPAFGRSFGELRREIEVRTATTKLGTQSFVSLGSVRAVSVLVLGEVRRPGRQQLSALSSVLDAVARAGGIKKTGSLRKIQVQRGNEVRWIDVYDLLFSGTTASDLSLQDGDRIVVAPLGATVAVTGDVKRPAVFEFPEGIRSLTLAATLELAGGSIRPRGNRYVQITFGEDGTELVVDLHDLSSRIYDGDIVAVTRRADLQAGGVHLEGHVRVPGRRSLGSVTTVGELLGSGDGLKEDAYLPFGALETADPATRARRLFPLNLQRILDGQEDYALRGGDRLIVLSGSDVRFLGSTDVHDILRDRVLIPPRLLTVASGGPAGAAQVQVAEPQSDRIAELQRLIGLPSQTSTATVTATPAPTAGDGQGANQPLSAPGGNQVARIQACPGLLRLTSVMANQSVERFAGALITRGKADDLRRLDIQPCPAVFSRYPELLPLVLEYVVTVNGAVREPGLVPVVGEVPITTIIAVSGGLSRDVDLTRVEVSRHVPDSIKGAAESSRGMVNLAAVGAGNVAVAAGDVIRFNAVFTDRDSGPVLMAGEFIRPGLYEIRRGERLSEVIARAGGLTPQAYPYGAIFTRESVKLAQEIGLRRAARELESALAVAAVRSGVDPSALAGVRRIAGELDTVEALGRVVIEADPTVLQVRPELDPVLEPGDRLYMPKRPNFVSVIGDVLNPGAMQFISGTTADQYIRQAGGYQKSADEGRVFVVYPNGAADPLAISAWNFNPTQLPPGSSIVVPKDPAPLDMVTLLREGTQIVGQLAIAAASLAVIARD